MKKLLFLFVIGLWTTVNAVGQNVNATLDLKIFLSNVALDPTTSTWKMDNYFTTFDYHFAGHHFYLNNPVQADIFTNVSPYIGAPYNTPTTTHVTTGLLGLPQQTINPFASAFFPWRLHYTNPSNQVVDWILVELRQGVSGSTSTVYTQSAFVKQNGDIVSAFNQPIVAEVPPGNYYISIRHRNHLGFRTSGTYTFATGSNNQLSLDFTDNSVLINGSYPPSQIGTTGVYAMNGGDANSDGSVDAFDTILWEQQNGLFDNYTNNADYNLDGSIDAFDTIIWEINNGKFEELD